MSCVHCPRQAGPFLLGPTARRASQALCLSLLWPESPAHPITVSVADGVSVSASLLWVTSGHWSPGSLLGQQSGGSQGLRREG